MQAYKWGKDFEKAAKATVNRYWWKAEHLGYTKEDLVQEAYFVFRGCVETYGTTQKEEFIKLFKTGVANYITTLSFKSPIDKKMLNLEEGALMYEPEPEQSLGYLATMVSEAPRDVKEVLNFAFNAPVETLQALGFGDVKGRGFSSNALLCKALGYDRDAVNLVKAVQNYFF